jgi:hypothetical protein
MSVVAGPARDADLRSHRADITDFGEEHGHHVLRIVGKSTKLVLVTLPPAVARAIDKRSFPAPPGRSC